MTRATLRAAVPTVGRALTMSEVMSAAAVDATGGESAGAGAGVGAGAGAGGSAAAGRRGSVREAGSAGGTLPRNFVPCSGVTDEAAEAAAADPKAFVMMHWNVLADGLAQSGNFAKLDSTPDVLTWEYRLPRLVADVRACDPDILSVVEMNRYDEFAAALKPLGYTGTFVEKTSSPCPRFGFPADGAAVFVRSSRFRLGTVVPVPFTFEDDGSLMNQRGVVAVCHDLAAANCKGKSEGKSEGGGRVVVLAAVHLKAKRGEACASMRARQVAQLLEATGRVAGECRERFENVGVVVQGDYNTDPGTVPYELTVGSSLGLTSVYGPHGKDSEPPITTWKFRPGPGGKLHEAKHTIDYQFHTRELVPRSLLELPTVEVMGADALPSAVYPSDHLHLATRFQFASSAPAAAAGTGAAAAASATVSE